VSDHAFLTAAAGRRLLLDGAMATYVHAAGAAPGPVRACDGLSISAPALVQQAHAAYLLAGADIVRTNTFRAASREYGHEAEHLCGAAARLARDAADLCTRRTPERPRFVAGAVGPADAHASPEQLRDAYRAPLAALLRGGVDLVLLETCCVPAHAAAALAGCADAASETGRSVPVLLSLALDGHGRLAASGASLDELLAAIEPDAFRNANGAGLGINCGAGPDGLADALRALRPHTGLVTCHPSAGLPDAQGHYPLDPTEFARIVSGYVAEGLADLVGGCCGTTPAHVAALARAGRE
jgi:5-methyltetrahydrofolate--homocysteine methyltransferase